MPKVLGEVRQDAIQVSDRFHPLKNLSETTERVIQRNYSAVKTVLNNLNQPTTNVKVTQREGEEGETSSAQNPAVSLPLKWHAAQKQARFQHRLALYEQVEQLHSQKYNISEIAQELEISRRRVRGLLKGPLQIKGVVTRPSKIDPYKAYLQNRFFKEGCHSGTELWKEIAGRGYAGSKTPVINYVTQLRQQLEEPDRNTVGRVATTQPTPLSDHLYNPRQLTRWFMGRSEHLKGSQPDKLAQLCLNISELGVTYSIVGGI